MLRRFIPHRNVIPKLIIAQRVIDKIVTAAQAYSAEETGEAMIGIFKPPAAEDAPPTIYVLDTLPPDIGDSDTKTVREQFAFIQGDMIHYEIFIWLNENWNVARQGRVSSVDQFAEGWDTPLIHPGDWHKQPGYMISPSNGDLKSALDQLDDPDVNKDFMLVPIVTMNHPTTTSPSPGTNYLLIPMQDNTSIRIDFWYIHKKVRIFQPISPSVIPDVELPELVSYPWHLENVERADAEFTYLRREKLFYSIVLWNVDNILPLEVCIAVARIGLNDIYILVTPHDYPKNPPTIYRAPYIAISEGDDIYDIFEQWWARAEMIALPTEFVWSTGTYLIDLIHTAENILGIKIPANENITDRPTFEEAIETDTSTTAEETAE